MKRVILFGSLTAAALATSALAQDTGQPPVPPRGPVIDFAQADADGDGKLTLEEIQAQGKMRMAERFALADADGDGVVTSHEMVAALEAQAEAQRKQRMERKVAQMFARADADEDGGLTLEELTPEEPRGGGRMFAMLDTDEDGAISQEEFDAAQQKMAERQAMGPRFGKPGGPRGGHEGGARHGMGPRGEGPRGEHPLPFFFGGRDAG